MIKFRDNSKNFNYYCINKKLYKRHKCECLCPANKNSTKKREIIQNLPVLMGVRIKKEDIKRAVYKKVNLFSLSTQQVVKMRALRRYLTT